MSRRAFEQLTNLETEMRESGTVYTCPSGQHDDLGISCAMLAWAARHPHLSEWVRTFERSRVIRKPSSPTVLVGMCREHDSMRPRKLGKSDDLRCP